MFPKEMLVVAFVAVIVLYFICKYFTERAMRGKEEESSSNSANVDPKDKNQHTAEDCAEGGCGMRAICNGNEVEEVVYFDDEELDRFKGRVAEDYNDTEVAEFREVLETLQGHDVAPWLNSLCARGIPLPMSLRQEAIALVNKNKK